MMKLKIDIATNNFKHGGGTERYTLDLVKGLEQTKHHTGRLCDEI